MPFTTRRPFPWAVFVAIVLIGFILRGPIIAVAPISGIMRPDLGLNAAQFGLLTTLPVLCFALVTPLASFFVGRAGANFATMIAILGVGVGSIIRSAGGVEAVFAGTIVMGAFITIGNVVVPVIIRRDVSPDRVAIVTGSYTSALNVSSMITSIATAPLALAFGWQLALLTWTGFVVLAAIGWLVAIGPRAAFRFGPLKPLIETGAGDTVAIDTSSMRAIPDGRPQIWRNATAVLLALAFAGQAFAYYGLTAWFPTILENEVGFSVTEAGSSSSIFQIAAVVGALGVPLLSRRLGVPRTYAIVAVLWMICPFGLLIAPQAWLLWAFCGGVAQGGGITIVFMLIVQLAMNGTHARRLSAMIQGVGYALGATSPTLVGAVHDATGGWQLPLVVVGIGTVAFSVAGFAGAVRASRPRES
ncbi:MFS transporter [Subtercola sp. YIM 133946]|uniref:MFS transporter n=1 Tax=Subtercola sp. YIM 133946 TaxID=3118909 RepID=UPI002F950775